MHLLRVEHSVPDFAAWKAVFDDDPVGREGGGVRGYRILRPVDDPNYVLIDLEFDDASAAEAFLVKLGELWARVQGRIMENPQARAEVVEIR